MAKKTTPIFIPFPKVFIDPCTDSGFKIIFCKEENQAFLIGFLTAIFPHLHIQSIRIKNPQVQSRGKGDRLVIFDIHCILDDGTRVIIEMQRQDTGLFFDRILFYGAMATTEQGKRGKWNYELRPLYIVSIVHFPLFEQPANTEIYRYDIQPKDQFNRIVSDKIHYTVLQLPHFKKKITELATPLEKWLFFLKKLPNFDAVPPAFSEDPLLKEACEVARIANLNKDDMFTYSAEWKAKNDTYAVKEFEKKQAKAEKEAFAKEVAEAKAHTQQAKAELRDAKAAAKEAKAEVQEAKAEAKDARKATEHHINLTVENLLLQTAMTIEQIAQIAVTTTEKVNTIRQRLIAEGKL